MLVKSFRWRRVARRKIFSRIGRTRGNNSVGHPGDIVDTAVTGSDIEITAAGCREESEIVKLPGAVVAIAGYLGKITEAG